MSTSYTYQDLEIRIFAAGENGYPVELTLNDEQEFDPGLLRPEIPVWLAGESTAAFGEKLFDWLFADSDLKEAWDKISGQHPQRRLRLRISAQAPELHAVPWEQLRDANDKLDIAAVESTPFSRYLPGRWQPGTHILKRPVRILVAIANPSNLQAEYRLEPVDVEQEWQTLQEAVAGADVELVQLPQPCTLLALQAELKNGYHILHFIGHGQFSERYNQARLFLADSANQTDLVNEQELADMLGRQLADLDVGREDKLRLVFLASCQSATRSPTAAFRGLAPALINAGVPAVVAMQDLVPMDTARQFTSTFYRRLLRHGLVDLAGNEARSAVMTAKLDGAVVPVIFNRMRDGRLLGQRGRITSKDAERFWPYLLEKIDAGLCIPFLGPHANEGLLPSPQRISEKLAIKYNYPLDDRQDLVRVAEYMSLTDSSTLRRDYVRLLIRSLFSFLQVKPTREQWRALRNTSFTQAVKELSWAERIVNLQENQLHMLLAELPFPLYVTTEFDSFMTEALQAKEGLTPRRLGLRWEPRPGSPQWNLMPPPSAASPAVLHLNGHDGEPEQLNHVVLSVDDYLAHFVRLSRDHDHILPSNVLGMLANSSYLFLGYDIEDYSFRSLLQGLLRAIAQRSRETKVNVGVQLSVDQRFGSSEIEAYLGRYMDQYDIDIYWGTTQQFVTELYDYWQKYEEVEDEGWDDW